MSKELVERLREAAIDEVDLDKDALMREAADALEKIQWVSVGERLPAAGERVEFFDALTCAVYIGRFSEERQCPNSEWGWHPSWTDWMPLPEPPND